MLCLYGKHVQFYMYADFTDLSQTDRKYAKKRTDDESVVATTNFFLTKRDTKI